MHVLRLKAPGLFDTESDVPIPEPPPEHLSIRLSTAAICGSDLPKFRSTADPRSGRNGFPVHECVGHVEATPPGCDLQPGQRVLAMPVDDCGLAEVYLARRDATHLIRAEHLSDGQATLIQPLSTVLHAINRLTTLVDVTDAHAVVLGLGPIGLLCAHVLNQRGAHVTGVDPVARSHDLLSAFGVSNHLQDTASAWERSRYARQPIAICVEAVGHQQRTIRDAITLTSHGGTILAMGVPDDREYAVPYETLLRKNLTLTTSITPPWRESFGQAEHYLLTHLNTLSLLLTESLPITEATQAYRSYATPAPDRLKVLLSTKAAWTSRQENP
jgi:L-iditol 2-dehydrogenase